MIQADGHETTATQSVSQISTVAFDRGPLHTLRNFHPFRLAVSVSFQ